MLLRELEFDSESLLDGPDQSPRSSGLHVSSIIRDLQHSIHGDRPEEETLGTEERRRRGTYISMGFAWERCLERSFHDAFASGSIVRPGEQCVDGIYLSPDLFDIEHFRLEEWKATWRSMKKADADLELFFRPWFWQMKAYCMALGTTEAVLRVFFVNGDYAASGPVIRCWLLSWTQDEIDSNWRMLIGHARSKGWCNGA